MKSFLTLTCLIGLTACGIFGGDDKVEIPVVREEFHACPDSEVCNGKYKGGGICMPSGSHHSVPEKCPKVQ